jgi:hypothetical protein
MLHPIIILRDWQEESLASWDLFFDMYQAPNQDLCKAPSREYLCITKIGGIREVDSRCNFYRISSSLKSGGQPYAEKTGSPRLNTAFNN